MNSIKKIAFIVAILCAGANSASATAYFLDKGGIYNPKIVHVSGAGFNQDVYASAVRFDANFGATGSASQFTLWGFCVDLFHSINVGINTQKALNLKYQTEPFVSDRHGNALNSTQIQQITGLASLGSRLIKLGDPDLANRLAAIQSAIWAIEYPTFSVTSADATVQGYINGYKTLAPSLGGKAFTIYAVDGKTQGFIIGVPEPQTWAMMIIGFGLIGLTLRDGRRRSRSLT